MEEKTKGEKYLSILKSKINKEHKGAAQKKYKF